jgi:hypothetical protein
VYVGIKEVKPLSGYKLLVTGDNGERRVFDVTPYLDHGVFSELRELSLFNSARVQFDTVEWPNGADLDPEVLWAESVPVEEGKTEG